MDVSVAFIRSEGIGRCSAQLLPFTSHFQALTSSPSHSTALYRHSRSARIGATGSPEMGTALRPRSLLRRVVPHPKQRWQVVFWRLRRSNGDFYTRSNVMF